MRHGIPVLSTRALYPIPCLLGSLPIDCDQCEIIEEIYQENIRAGDRDALHPDHVAQIRDEVRHAADVLRQQSPLASSSPQQ